MGRVIVGVGPDGHFKFVKHSSSTREPVDVELFNLDHQLDFFTHLRRNIANVFLCYILRPIRNFGKDLAEREAKEMALNALLRRLRELAILHDDEYNVLQDQDISLELRANKIFLTLDIHHAWDTSGEIIICPDLKTVQDATTAILDANADWFPKWEKNHAERRKINFRSSAFVDPRFTISPLCYSQRSTHPADRDIMRPAFNEPHPARVTAEGVWAFKLEDGFQDVGSWSPPPTSRAVGERPAILLFVLNANDHLVDHFSRPGFQPLPPAAAELHEALKSLTRAIFDVPPGWMDHRKSLNEFGQAGGEKDTSAGGDEEGAARKRRSVGSSSERMRRRSSPRGSEEVAGELRRGRTERVRGATAFELLAGETEGEARARQFFSLLKFIGHRTSSSNSDGSTDDLSEDGVPCTPPEAEVAARAAAADAQWEAEAQQAADEVKRRSEEMLGREAPRVES